MIKLFNADCLEQLKKLKDNCIDSIVTDPPYGISFMSKKWDYDVPKVEIWKECLRVLKPGGHLLSFAGTRTQHRMAVNIEDAGFEIRDMIAWVYGCLTEDTEIFTSNGWQRYHEKIDEQLVLCYDVTTDKFEFQKPTKKYLYQNKHTAYHIQSEHTDQIVSRNHRCIVVQDGILTFKQAETLESQEHVPFIESLSEQQNQKVQFTTANISPIEYKGNMWCVEVPYGAFIARRNDKIFITGNSGFPKSQNIAKAIDKYGGNPDLVDEISKQLKKARTKRGIGLTEADKIFCNGSSNYSWYEGRPQGNRIPDEETFKKIAGEWQELKSLQLKVAQAEREIIGKHNYTASKNHGTPTLCHKERVTLDITAPATAEAKKWDGWGSAIKPSMEPITLARKPLSEKTIASNVLKWCTGGINIDDSRIKAGYPTPVFKHRGETRGHCYGAGLKGINRTGETTNKDRWPANLIWSCYEDEYELIDNIESEDKKKVFNWLYENV